jgi:two-component system cell cycle sensor histidine kinase/response regulator CckA
LEEDPEARLIVASGYSNDPVLAEYRKHGFRAAVAKPFSLKELHRAIAAAL